MNHKNNSPSDACRYPLLSQTLQKAFEAHKKEVKSQTVLAEKTGIDRGEICKVFAGQQAVSAWALASLALELDLDLADLFLLKALDELRHPDDPDQLAKHVLDGNTDMRLAIECLRHEHATLKPPPPKHPEHLTLCDWRTALKIEAVIVGDRRESPFHGIADALALPASTGDLTHYGQLGLTRARIRSDKIIYAASTDSLRRQLKGDILVVASPGANLAARPVNDQALFRFYIPSEARQKLQRFEEDLKRMEDIRTDVNEYFDNPDRLRELKHMLFEFAQSGFIDPVDYKGLRGLVSGRFFDFGLVTICRNPWCEDGVAILAAGIRGPGTAAALELLGDPESFKDHPLGGVFKVEFNADAVWERRYDKFKITWDSHPCANPIDYLTAADALAARVKKGEVAPDKGLSDNHIEEMRKLMAVLQRRAPKESISV